LIDVPLSARPWRFCHLHVPLTYGFIYVAFQLIYILGFDGKDAYGNDYIYTILDWKHAPGIAVGWVFGILVMLVFSYGFLCLLVFARDKLWEKWAGTFQKETARLTVENPSYKENSTKNYDTMQL
jgi:hypothetical protein